MKFAGGTGMAGRDILTSSEENLLGRFVDKECGIVGRYRAKRLLRKNVHAGIFLAGLESLKENLIEYESRFPEPPADLWGRIDARITQEERLLSLDDGSAGRGWFEQVFLGLGRVSWGAAGGFAAAALLLLVGNVFDTGGQSSSPHYSSSISSQPVQLASGEYKVNSPRMEAGAGRRYDYLRSDGRVRVIRNPSQRSTIFWIRKRTDQQIAPDRNRVGVFYLDPQMAAEPVLQGD